MFIRTKTINKHKYSYLVENKRINGSSRQKVIAYLGIARKLKKSSKNMIISLFKQAQNKCMSCGSQNLLGLSQDYKVLCKRCIV